MYLAYLKWVKRNGEEPTLPGLPYSPKQVGIPLRFGNRLIPRYLLVYPVFPEDGKYLNILLHSGVSAVFFY